MNCIMPSPFLLWVASYRSKFYVHNQQGNFRKWFLFRTPRQPTFSFYILDTILPSQPLHNIIVIRFILLTKAILNHTNPIHKGVFFIITVIIIVMSTSSARHQTSLFRVLAILQFLHSQSHITIARIALTNFCEFLLSRRHKCVPAIAFRMLYGKYERSLTTTGAYKFLFLMKQYNAHTITFSISRFSQSHFRQGNCGRFRQ